MTFAVFSRSNLGQANSECQGSNKPSVVLHFASFSQPWPIHVELCYTKWAMSLTLRSSFEECWLSGLVRTFPPTAGRKPTDQHHNLTWHPCTPYIFYRQQQNGRRCGLHDFIRALLTAIPSSWLAHSFSTSFRNSYFCILLFIVDIILKPGII